MEPTTLAAYSLIGHYAHLLDQSLPPQHQGVLFEQKLRQQLELRKATIISKDGQFKIAQAADPGLLLLIDGQEFTLQSLADEAMGTSKTPATQASNEPESAFHRQLRQARTDAGLQALPNSGSPPEDVNRYLQPFYKQLEQSRAAAEKNYK